ncbi:hypothetical protein [Sphingomonas jatrophae]|uniref:SnoaL-like domain-containing protein n=1 Tax=Sphingomonas jatrophae TaxID=1166337 RepID=A0A1I6K4U5_9SPHN|nr:hypothetical protein [Sphingomonas jatrophae]SFR86285.1 hypothetical protein SAMN05192580_1333 [Sphingomonas jatrophae]
MLLALALATATPDAAADVVRRYYALLAARNYAQAWRLWGDDGRASGKPEAAFARGFARTATTSVNIGRPGRVEGAAGSLYVTVPVTVSARLLDGTRQHFTGSYTLRRVNDVPGSTARQRRWHIASAHLRPHA